MMAQRDLGCRLTGGDHAVIVDVSLAQDTWRWLKLYLEQASVPYLCALTAYPNSGERQRTREAGFDAQICKTSVRTSNSKDW